ncbi:hypothetical protein Dxin01_03926 [Deinococcus xinjiangensis]|uniref:Lipoprotein n=1 Tax=Deinococcus xinjiangensis TaxID=457454 RepID=A0ABP9VKG8_9DEIO
MLNRSMGLKALVFFLALASSACSQQCSTDLNYKNFIISSFCKQNACASNEAMPPFKQGLSIIHSFYAKADSEIDKPSSEIFIERDIKSGHLLNISYLYWDFYGSPSNTDMDNIKKIYTLFTGSSLTAAQIKKIYTSIDERENKPSFYLSIPLKTCNERVYQINIMRSSNTQGYHTEVMRGPNGEKSKVISPISLTFKWVDKK